LNIIESINGEENKIKAFNSLIPSVKGLNDKCELIKERFPDYLDELEELLKKERDT
jgi:hypothetical protein